MGQDIELDFEKYCVLDGSPTTVLHTMAEKKKVRKKPKCLNEVLLSQNKKFREINLNRYRSSSCREVQSTRFRVNEAIKTSYVCQSLNEVGKINKISDQEDEGRKKIEFSASDGLLPIEIFASLCNSDVNSSSFSESSSNSVNKVKSQPFVSTPLNKSLSSRLEQPQSPIKLLNDDEDSSSFFEISSKSINKVIDQTFVSTPLQKSLSSRLEIPHSPTNSKNESSNTNSPKTLFTPLKKMFDPFVKSKSQNSQNTNIRKALIHDISNTNDDSSSITSISSSSSPAHLNAVLKLGNKNQMPYFEFLVKNQNDFLVAKTQKVGNGCDWVYTFHNGQHKRKINNKDFTTVGQMQVSCYLCTELVNAGAFDNSMVTEFVMYDLSSEGTRKSTESTEQSKVNVDQKFLYKLHPDLETAAIVIQFPSEKRESLKCNQMDMKIGDMFNFSQMKIEKNEPAKVSVVIPSGTHGSPSDESRGSSPLLDRWRLGGGCDCGGWDMGCPLIVLGNLNIQQDDIFKQPVRLFLKGTKENIPSLTMKITEDGQYAVDFHAQLTTLQAFSICVAILHTTETSIVVDHDNNREMLQCDSMRVFVEDEVKQLIEIVAEEDKRKGAKNEISSSFLVNPPFSPMSRV